MVTRAREHLKIVWSTNAGWILAFRAVSAIGLYLAVRGATDVSDAHYRLLTFVVAFISVSQGLDFGIGSALTELATRMPQARGSLVVLRRLARTAGVIVGTASGVATALILIVLPTSAVGVGGGDRFTLAAALGLVTALNVGATGRERVLIGLGYHRLAMTATAAVAGATALTVLVVARLGYVFPGLLLGLLVGGLLRQVTSRWCMAVVARRHGVEQEPAAISTTPISHRRIASNTAIFFCLQLVFLVSFQSDTLVANAVGGERLSRPYATALRFFVNVPGVVGILAQPLWRLLASKVSAGDPEDTWRTFARAERRTLVGSAALASGICALLLAAPSVLLGGPFGIDDALVWVGWTCVLSWGQIMAYLLASLELLKFQLMLSAVMMVLNIGLSIWFTKTFGAIGPALGTLVAYSAVIVVPARARARRICARSTLPTPMAP